MTLLPIILPQGFTPKVSTNDKVTPDTIIAEKESAKEEIINVSFLDEKNLEKVLKKNIGDSIKEGDEIAARNGKLGIGAKKILSKYSGIITKIDKDSGDIYIRTGQGEEIVEKIFSPVVGVVDICNNEKIVIKTDKDAIFAEDAVGKKGEGEAYYIEDLDFNKLTSEISDKIVIVKSLDKTALFKVLGLSALGIITEEVEDIDFIDLNEKKISIPILNVSDEDFKKVVKNKNKKMFLDGEKKTIVIL